MPGGQQVGGPIIKGTMSRLAGRSLRTLAHVGTRDATNSFKAYSTDFIKEVGIDSRDGFVIGIELTAKAKRLRRPVAEIPTIWLDRQAGVPNFKIAKWVPSYVRWYRFAFGPRLTAQEVRKHRPGHPHDEQAETAGELMEQVLVSGSAGFIGGYVVEELLIRGYAVIGIDNFSKYGKVKKSYDDHPRYRIVEGDARDVALMTELLADCDHFIAGAAMIGGISYFHTYAYDLLAANERINAASCDAAIAAHRDGRLRKVTYLSSSMVFETATEWPSYEGQQREIPPPLSSYGFQKLAVEYFARAAWDQYHLPYTLLRPFNCVGIGESRALGDEEILSGNVRLAMSHVVPDLVLKVLKGQDPLHILGSGEQIRHYTYGGDLAAGVVTAMEHEAAYNEDFNLSTAESTSVRELAEIIWRKVHGTSKPLRLVHDDPFEYDVQRRVPATEKAKRLLGFDAATSLDTMLDEVIPWIDAAITAGTI
jgi:UDP-glucose 4-epimerase